MRISDWSSDLCSSDLSPTPPRKGEGLRELRRLAQLRELLQHHLALQPRQMVDEENAFQMVVLVLDARRHQPGHALLMMLAVLVLPVDGDLGGARHLGILFGDRQAALLIDRSEEHTSELQSLMRISYAVFCLNKKTPQ